MRLGRFGFFASSWLFGSIAHAVAAADPVQGIGFQKDDWELACDNTGTCRAAGYQAELADDEDSPPASLKLTRQAGPHAPVEVLVRLGMPDERMQVRHVRMRLNGKDLGEVPFDTQSETGPLTSVQASALLTALPRSARIEFVAGKVVWRVSDSGSAAVLLKMDDVQGRVGTPGALVRKGQRPEKDVPAARELPRLMAPKLMALQAGDAKLAQRLLPALRAALSADSYCELLTETRPDAPVPEVDIKRLDAHRLLASTACWLAAYNAGNGYWVVEDKPPYKATMVTDSGSDDSDSTIFSSQKGRGIGDCFSLSQWTWNGQRFVLTQLASTGMCRGMPGGAWELPTLVWAVTPR